MFSRHVFSGYVAAALALASLAANAQMVNVDTLPTLPALPLAGAVSDPIGAINDILNFSFSVSASFGSAGIANFPVSPGSGNLYNTASSSATLYAGFNESGSVIGPLNTITPGVLHGSGSLSSGNSPS